MPFGCEQQRPRRYTNLVMDMHTAGIVVASGVAATSFTVAGLAYAANWPTSQIFGATLVDVPASDPVHHTVALTFDDGPSPLNTPVLLEALAAAGVHATFFLIGNHVRRHPELAQRVVAAGHTIGNHTNMHPNLSRKPAERIQAELRDCQQIIADVTGTLPIFFRPPYGARRPIVLRTARELGMTPVMWNITAGDWASPGHARLLARVEKGMASNRRRGRTSNVLLHDASHLDGLRPHSRADTISVVQALLQRPDLRFVPVTAFLLP